MNENELMLTSVLNCRRLDLYVDQRPLNDEEQRRLEHMKDQRAQGRPVQYIIGECEFMGIKLKVDERALIPRPETEILVDLACKHLRDLALNKEVEVLDIGTGCGNIAIALVRLLNNCKVSAIDVSKDALDLAQENAARHQAAQDIRFIRDDMRTFLTNISVGNKKFDLVISNPPYVPRSRLAHLPEDVRQEPRLALDGGGKGLEYLTYIVKNCHNCLKPGGMMFLETDDTHRETLEILFDRHSHLEDVVFYQDYSGAQRIVSARKKVV